MGIASLCFRVSGETLALLFGQKPGILAILFNGTEKGGARKQRRRGPVLLFRHEPTFIGWPMRFAAGVFRLLVAHDGFSS